MHWLWQAVSPFHATIHLALGTAFCVALVQTLPPENAAQVNAPRQASTESKKKASRWGKGASLIVRKRTCTETEGSLG